MRAAIILKILKWAERNLMIKSRIGLMFLVESWQLCLLNGKSIVL